MYLRSLACACVLVLHGFVPCLAQQPGQMPARTAEADAGPKRPAGTVTRPKDGVQHPDLDKAWADYDAAVAKAAEEIRAAIAKQFDAATAKGDLNAAEKWQVISEKFQTSGELPSESEKKTVVSVTVATCKKAKDELGKAYDAVVKTLTRDKKIVEAKAVRSEWSAVGPQQAKLEPRVDKKVWLSDLQERNTFVGYGTLGKNGELGYEGLTIVVGGRPSQKGISMHPPSNGISKVTYDVPVGCTHFEGEAAIADGRLPQATPVVFRVINEKDRLLWQSKPIHGAGKSEKCRIALTGAKSLTLTVECPGSHNYAYAVWINPVFCQ